MRAGTSRCVKILAAAAAPICDFALWLARLPHTVTPDKAVQGCSRTGTRSTPGPTGADPTVEYRQMNIVVHTICLDYLCPLVFNAVPVEWAEAG